MSRTRPRPRGAINFSPIPTPKLRSKPEPVLDNNAPTDYISRKIRDAFEDKHVEYKSEKDNITSLKK